MQVDPASGRVTWSPSDGDIGTHDVVLRVEDGRGGFAEQRFVVSATEPPPNRPPYFTSVPVVDAIANRAYAYQATATDPDGDPLAFSLVSGPAWMTVDPTKGVVEWTPGPSEHQRTTVIQTLGDNDFFGFKSGAVGEPVPSIEFDNREPDDPPFTGIDARLGKTLRPQGHNDLTWTHDLSGLLGGRTPVSATLTLAIGGVQDGADFPEGNSIDDRLFLDGIEVPGAFDDLDQEAPGEARGGRGTGLVSFTLSQQQLAALGADGHLDVFIEGGFQDANQFNDSYFIDYAQLAVTAEGPPAIAGCYDVQLSVSDGRGGTATHAYAITVQPGPTNHPPVIVSQPVTTVAPTSAPPGADTPVGPGAWTTVQYVTTDQNRQPDAEWEIDPTGSSASQPIQSNASILVSDFTLANDHIEGSFREDSSDDDFVGFVFGYQDSTHFYLFDWKQAGQTQPTPNGEVLAQTGMSVKVVDADSPLTVSDLWPTEGNGSRVRTIFHNDIGRSDSTEYGFALGYHPGGFRIAIKQGAAVLAEIDLADATYGAGRFGFYNYSEDHAVFHDFRLQSIFASDYSYLVRAIDPDGDPLTFSLAIAPAAMTIDSSTGLINWQPDVSEIGPHPVSIRVEDGRGGSDEQSYSIDVRP